MQLRVDPSLSRLVLPNEAPLAPSGPGAISIPLEPQGKSNWCWAAIACAVSGHYGAGRLSQGEVARMVLGAAGGDLDDAAHLDVALGALGLFDRWSAGRPAFDHVCREIGLDRPLAACLSRPRRAAHYVLVAGAFLGSREIYVLDPKRGPSVQGYDAFPQGYDGAGARWQGTYWTRPPAGPRLHDPSQNEKP